MTASIFSPVTLTWKGTPYVIPPERMLRAIAIIEQVITLEELNLQRGRIPLAKVSMAFGGVLRFAGAKATDDQVYAALWTDKDTGTVEQVQTLLLMMLPPSIIKAINEAKAPPQEGTGGTEGNVEPPKAEAL